jgi:hypothetical protein
VHERALALLPELLEPLEGLGGVARVEVDCGAVGPGRSDLRLARPLPHDDEAVDSLERAPIGEALRVVSRRDRDHAALLLLGREGGEPREDAAGLE